MKILIISQYFKPEPFKVTDLCLELHGLGHNITVLTGIPNYPKGRPYKGYGYFKNKRENFNGIDVIHVPLIYRGRSKIRLILNYISFAIFGSIRALLIIKKYDIVLVYQLTPIIMAIPGIVYSKIHHIPLAIYTLDLWPDSIISMGKIVNHWIVLILKILVEWIYSNSSKIGVSSKSFIERIVSKNVPIKKIIYVPQYANDPIEDNFCIFKNNFILKNNLEEFIIVFTGNFGYAQGLDLIIDAASIIRHQVPKIKWILIGDGRAKNDLMRQVKKNHIEDKVKFINPVSEREANQYILQSNAAIIILKKDPLFSLTIPAKLQTYLACGIPILGSIDGESARIIIESGSGLVGAANDLNALVQNAIQLAKSPNNILKKYSLCSRKYFLENFKKEKHINGILSLFS